MSKHDIKQYLEKIYNVPVLKIAVNNEDGKTNNVLQISLINKRLENAHIIPFCFTNLTNH